MKSNQKNTTRFIAVLEQQPHLRCPGKMIMPGGPWVVKCLRKATWWDAVTGWLMALRCKQKAPPLMTEKMGSHSELSLGVRLTREQYCQFMHTDLTSMSWRLNDMASPTLELMPAAREMYTEGLTV